MSPDDLVIGESLITGDDGIPAVAGANPFRRFGTLVRAASASKARGGDNLGSCQASRARRSILDYNAILNPDQLARRSRAVSDEFAGIRLAVLIGIKSLAVTSF